MKATDTERDVKELEYIVDSIQLVRNWCAHGRESLSDDVVAEAVESRLRKIAESTQRLSTSCKASESDIPWDQISGFRNVMTHDYHEIDRDRLWNVVEYSLRMLEEAAERMLVRKNANLNENTRTDDRSC